LETQRTATVDEAIAVKKIATPLPRISTPQMDGVRALACLMVLIGHSFILNLPASFAYVGALGRTGVWLFFVLSAFLLTWNLCERGLNAASLVEYAVARILRILPLFFCALLFYYSLGMIGLTSIGTLVSAATFQSWAGHLWTIPPEFSFYVVLPVIVWVLLQVKRLAGLVAAAIVLLAGLAVASFLWWPFRTPANFITLGPYLPTFCSGIVAAFAARFLPAPKDIVCRSMMMGSASVIFITFVLTKVVFFSDPVAPLVGMHVWFGLWWALFVYASFSSVEMRTGFLSNSILTLIGRSSYSIYLFHWAFLEWTAHIPFPLGVLTCIPAAIGVGLLSFNFIEIKLFNLRRPITRFLLRA
jgi:peptidoglycan/LPS O-acetylase OafA/YrhL